MGCDEHRCLIKDMEATLERVKPPKLEPNCCIYKVPEVMRKSRPEAYTPKMVSIGPSHHGKEGLKPMEELKLRFLKSYLERTDMKFENCIKKLKEKEEYIQSCYAETILQSSDDLVKMILIDASFIIEYFLRIEEYNQWIEIDPLLSKPGQATDMLLDLILLENQLPFSVLEDLFPLTCFAGKYSSFLEVSIHILRRSFTTLGKLKDNEFSFGYFCEHHLKKKRWPNGEYEEIKVLHLTVLLRILHLPSCEIQSERELSANQMQLYSASQLLEAGVKFKVCHKSLTELQFKE